jgi:hypothetical protein
MWCNAGWGPTEIDATFVGEQCAATAQHALLLSGVFPVEMRSVVLEFDPCHPEQDSPAQVAVSDKGVPTPVDSQE